MRYGGGTVQLQAEALHRKALRGGALHVRGALPQIEGGRYRRSNMKWCMESIVACCSLTRKASTSPMVMTPARPLSLTTGRCRIRFAVIIAAHSSTLVSGAHAMTGAVIASATRSVAGSRRCATTRRRMSRSVKMPTGRPFSATISPPMARSFMSCAAASTVSPGAIVSTSLPFLARMSRTVGMVPPPGWGVVPRYYRAAGADATLPLTTSGGVHMARAGINVGPLDARARLIAGSLALVGGLAALDGFFQALGFLTWLLTAVMMYVGILLAMGGRSE